MSMSKSITAAVSLLGLAAVILAFPGCKPEEVEQAVAPVLPAPPSRPAPPPKPENRIELTAGDSILTDGCHLRLLQFSDGRAAVLTISSYADPSVETLPSIMLRAVLDSPNLTPGTEIQAELYALPGQEAEVWHSPVGSPVTLKITEFSGERASGTVVSGEVLTPSATAPQSLTGSFTGIVIGPESTSPGANPERPAGTL